VLFLSFKNFVAEARRNTPPLKKIDPSKPIPNLIDDTKTEQKKEGLGLRREVNWENCLHKRNNNGTPYCAYFLSPCAKEKCKKKFME